MSELRSRAEEPTHSASKPEEVAGAQGSVLAALVSAGLGCAVLGVTDVLADVSPSLNRAFDLYNPSGALSGETSMAVLLWLLTWFALERRWSRQPPRLVSAITAALALLVAGLALTFPPLVDRLTGH